MRLLTSAFLLCLFLSPPAMANISTQEPHQSLLRFSLFEVTISKPQQGQQKNIIATQPKHFIYRTTLAEILVYQLLSLTFALSLFYLNTNQ